MKRILIVDDDVTSIEIIQAILENLGYVTHAITDPGQIIATIRIMYPDLILLDWYMPQIDGIDVLKAVKNHKEYKHIPVIFTTGFRTSSKALKIALDAGAIDFIRKPLDEIELGARVASALRIADCNKQNIKLAVENKNDQLQEIQAQSVRLEEKLKKKDREISLAAVGIHQSKKLLTKLKEDLLNSHIHFEQEQQNYLLQVISKYDNTAHSINWRLFEQCFIEINAEFYNKLYAVNSDLTWGELRLCALLRIGMSVKEISIINYASYDAIQKTLYRIRRKLNIGEGVDIHVFLQKF